jgi:hypothetical protein
MSENESTIRRLHGPATGPTALAWAKLSGERNLTVMVD